jgi:hypothetical protein
MPLTGIFMQGEDLRAFPDFDMTTGQQAYFVTLF